jgi:hypothetical protein
MRSPIKNPCPQKLALLKEYVATLGIHNADMRDYCNRVEGGRDREDLRAIKKRVDDSRLEFERARKWYTDHVAEHGCLPILTIDAVYHADCPCIDGSTGPPLSEGRPVRSSYATLRSCGQV